MAETVRLLTRWRQFRRWRWRIGLARGEWWIGWRYDFRCDWFTIGVLGLTLLVARRD